MTPTGERKQCSQCPDTFHDSSGLRRHMRRKHGEASPAPVEFEPGAVVMPTELPPIAVPEPVPAHMLSDGDPVLWLGEKRTIETIRRVDTGELMIRFGGSRVAYVTRDTIIRRFEP